LIVYSALTNVLFDIFTDIQSEFNMNFFLRDSLFVILVLSLAALIASKYHALIISSIYITAAIVFNRIYENEFLQSSIAMLILYVSSYSVVVYFFVDILEKSIKEREKQEEVIYKQNGTLNKANIFLEESQQQIEEQAEELRSTNELLNSKNKELMELNSMKNKFFSIIGHDLKNPIGIILGFSEILKTKISRLSDKKRDLYINNLYNSAKNTYSLLENLLAWARSQSGKLIINPGNVDLLQLIDLNILLYKETLNKKNISIATKFPDKKTLVLCDRNMADVVIRNILHNAIKFTNPEGEISISVTNDKKKKRIVTEISDTGIGIQKKDLDNLFSLNRNFSATGTNGESGTGLGLILCKEFIEKNKGEIWVNSEPGKGSTFAFHLPQAPDG
jgi:signal transduction histidine kinase